MEENKKMNWGTLILGIVLGAVVVGVVWMASKPATGGAQVVSDIPIIEKLTIFDHCIETGLAAEPGVETSVRCEINPIPDYVYELFPGFQFCQIGGAQICPTPSPGYRQMSESQYCRFVGITNSLLDNRQFPGLHLIDTNLEKKLCMDEPDEPVGTCYEGKVSCAQCTSGTFLCTPKEAFDRTSCGINNTWCVNRL